MKKATSYIFLPIVTFLLITLFAPDIADAQTVPAIIKMVGGIFTRLAPLFVGVAFLMFLIGIVQFIWSGDNEKARIVGRTFMIWGIVALFLMVSVWGIKEVLQRIFGLQGRASGPYPIINLGDGGGGTTLPIPPPMIP